jgi:hypothetical protein
MNNLKFPFYNSELVLENCSQAGQDLFVLSVLKGKRNGTYIEIGAGPYKITSNTYILEKQFDWKGVAVELNPGFFNDHKNNRSHHIEFVDGTKVNYADLLVRGGIAETLIDYVSLDLDGDATLNALYNLPFDTHKFAVITYEHDCYICGPEYREKSREFLQSKGYTLLVSNIEEAPGIYFEDWWVNPGVVDNETINKMRSDGPEHKLWYNYLFI